MLKAMACLMSLLKKIEKNYSYNAGCNAGGKVFIFSILCVVLTLYIDQAANILLIS